MKENENKQLGLYDMTEHAVFLIQFIVDYKSYFPLLNDFLKIMQADPCFLFNAPNYKEY